MKEYMKRIKLYPLSVVRQFDERDPRSPAIRPDPPMAGPDVRTVAQILKELRNASNVETQPQNNLGIRI